MQDTDFIWFEQHCTELFKKFGEKYVAIKDKCVLGVYDSYADGVHTTMASEKPGTFIVQKCGEDESAYTGYIASMNFC